MKYLKISKWLLAITFIFWMAETAYFGWNRYPINSTEKACDDVVGCGFAVALGIREYGKWLKKQN